MKVLTVELTATDIRQRKRPRSVRCAQQTRLGQLRESRNLSAWAVAEALGVGDSSLSRWECGTRFPSRALLFRILAFYDVSFEAAFGDRGEAS